MRGRVMALYMAIFMGGTPIGAPIIGWVGGAFGPRWTILVGGLVSLVTALVALAYVLRTRRLQLRYRLRETPHLLVTTTPRERARLAMRADQEADTRSAA
jgi:MFS family permease